VGPVWYLNAQESSCLMNPGTRRPFQEPTDLEAFRRDRDRHHDRVL
jgi:hypothetical protein